MDGYTLVRRRVKDKKGSKVVLYSHQIQTRKYMNVKLVSTTKQLHETRAQPASSTANEHFSYVNEWNDQIKF